VRHNPSTLQLEAGSEVQGHPQLQKEREGGREEGRKGREGGRVGARRGKRKTVSKAGPVSELLPWP
jgi:hypothetical protein